MSANYDYLGKIKKAIEYAQKSRKIYIDLNFKYGIGTASFNIGGMLYHYGDGEGALNYLLESLKIFKEINNPLWIARILWKLKEIYLKKGNIKKYKKTRDKALILIQKTEASLDLTTFIFESIPEMLNRDHKIEDDEDARVLLKEILDVQKECLEIFQNAYSPQLIGQAMTGIGYTYTMLGNYSEALRFYNSAISIHEGSGSIYFLAITYRNIAEFYLRQENPTKALESYRDSLQIYQNLLQKLEGTNLYLDFKNIFISLPKLVEDIKETIYYSCFMEDQYDDGMTLRDYFAGQALVGILANERLLQVIGEESQKGKRIKGISNFTGEIADAMIKERNV